MLQQPSLGKRPSEDRVSAKPWAAVLAAATLLALTASAAAETHKEFHYTVGPNAIVSIVNQNGTVTVRPSSGRQVSIAATLQSDKVEVDSNQNGNRITARTHVLQKPTANQGQVDYEVSLPADSSISIDSGSGQIHIADVQGHVSVESDAAQVDVSGVNNGSVQIQTVNGPVSLTDLKQTRVQVNSTGGNVQLASVTGPKVTVQTTTGTIKYAGDFSGGGTYNLMNHTGDIEVRLPSSASIDLSARSVKGSVENDFPFQKNIHPSFQLAEGRAFAGTSNSGASSVELRSFSGKIRVKKQ